mmetsp:Transcript_4243/g.11552  ORF Transcript_4243/g.11552 Transcript_4243/m.11552 type:complete len:775 (+) Transcript_4243:125-2449(+)|eukprot:CAMPEP_0168720468 /NCGR_PEP_ID=MMETSP0724-20121128/1577_1 /TAXON_ID=265536 /ORGANISM="Amphiprora sp., Strain CCMP467" /LENGTH=774 /DNA_ID=CAMNT_0008767069 /DNA_START=31 /DNA_END=2355 /DNA_ORIENTATION=-
MTGTAAEDAIEKARAIAARLQQQNSASVPAGGADSSAAEGPKPTRKRRWGLAADDAPSVRVDDGGSKKPNLRNSSTASVKDAELLSKRMWISTSTYRPAAHFVNFLKDDLEEVPKKMSINEDAGGKVITALEGRGSGGKPPTPGMPLEPLHVLLQASSQSLLTRAELVVDDLLQRAEEATVHPDLIAAATAEEAKNSDNTPEKKTVASTSLALATIQDPSMRSTSTSYKPASVAQLIGQVNHGGGASDAANWVEENVGVPVGVVGFIIGKGGENIASMQARTGAKVQVQRETESSANVTQRNIQVAAPSQEALDECKQLIQNIVAEKSKMFLSGSGSGMGSRKDAARLEEAKAMGHVHVTYAVPDEDVGLVIGKGGATIRSLQDRSGANIQVPPAQDSKDGKRMIHITHPNQEGAEHAQQLIKELLQSNAGANGGANMNRAASGEPQVTATMMIPDADVGLCIGRSGVVIKFLQDTTQCRIQIPPDCLPGQDQRLATIIGPAAGCQQAQMLIGQIIADQSSAGVMAQAPPSAGGGYGAGSYGNYYTSNGQQKQLPRHTPPTEGQEGYSAEWAAYHAAQAAAAKATVPSQQTQYPYQGGYSAHPYQQPYSHQNVQAGVPVATTASGGGAAAPGAPASTSLPGGSSAATSQPASGEQPKVEQRTADTAGATTQSPADAPNREAYYEQFFRYAYYYGEAAARSYYGAWSPPEGTKNPYGANPNGVTAAPAATSSQAGAPANAPAAVAPNNLGAQGPAAGRETSKRKVSNLPAWMSKS